MSTTATKWEGFPLYDRPLGAVTEGIDDGRPIVVISNFSRCEPAERISQRPAAGQWTLIDYETDLFPRRSPITLVGRETELVSGHAERQSGSLELHDGEVGVVSYRPESISGRMLHALRDNPAGDLTLALDLTGWYAVYVWLMGGDADLEPQFPADFDSVFSVSAGPALKLTDDPRFCGTFRTLSHDRMMWPGLEACFWRHADLTDQSLVIRHQGAAVYLGAVHLIPLSPAEVEAIQVERAAGASSHRRLIIKCDHPDPVKLEPRIEQLKNRDVAAWICGNEDSGDLFVPDGSPKLQWAKAAAHEIGAEFYVCDRPGLWSLHRHWPDPRGRFYEEHPELRCKDRDGTDTHQMSLAEPLVVQHLLDRVRQTARNEPDGFGFFFNRDPGLVLFEPAATEGFQEKHGVDPRAVDDRDERLLEWRAEIITTFLRKVRLTLNAIAAQRGCGGRGMKMVAVVLGDEAANRCFSYDVATWVRDGLVDVLCPYPWTDYPDRWLAQGFVDVDVKYFAELVRGTDCKLYPMWLAGRWRSHWTPEHVRASEYFTKAMRDYADGADGIAAWDFLGLDAAFKADRWLHLGHKEQLAEWAADDFPLPPKLRFTRLGGRTPERFPAGTGG